MKNKFLKVLGLVLSFVLTISNCPRILAGSGISKSKKVNVSPEMQQANNIINGTRERHAFMNHPVYAEDGGLAYFWAWNKIRQQKDFNAFAEKYRNIKNNTKSAKFLPDSEINEDWKTIATFGNVYNLEFFEESKDTDPSKYLLRIDEKNNLIYTVRKSGGLYLFSFYIAYINYGEPRLIRSCFVVSSDMRNIKNILLPVDKALFD